MEADGRFRGPGVSDNGAGLAALLAMAAPVEAVRAEPAGSLPAACCWWPMSAKRAKAICWACAISASNPRWRRSIEAFVVVDGANTDHITTRALGSRRFEVVFTGPGGHSWSDYGVGNPLHALCRAVALFSETRLEGAPKSAFNVGLIEGGSSVNAIAQSARAKVDIRSESNEKMDELVELLSAAVERARDLENQRATGGKVACRLKEIGSRPAAALAEDAAILHYAARRGRAPGHPLAPGLLLHRRQHSALAGHSGHRHRRRRSGRRRPYHRRNGSGRKAATWA